MFLQLDTNEENVLNFLNTSKVWGKTGGVPFTEMKKHFAFENEESCSKARDKSLFLQLLPNFPSFNEFFTV